MGTKIKIMDTVYKSVEDVESQLNLDRDGVNMLIEDDAEKENAIRSLDEAIGQVQNIKRILGKQKFGFLNMEVE